MDIPHPSLRYRPFLHLSIPSPPSLPPPIGGRGSGTASPPWRGSSLFFPAHVTFAAMGVVIISMPGMFLPSVIIHGLRIDIVVMFISIFISLLLSGTLIFLPLLLL
eukprot:gb/GECH01002199.1/.p1 GENE.gb/GECH01002199.1/~~gb/GECH01002199.1/.p1  ORF type:complete len:106 (+),score=17.95 gb/GECH01002199.1/:1-318(+)